MALRAVVGTRTEANDAVMRYAITRAPSLIIDCANVADIHTWYREYPYADFSTVAVVELELLYKFRDVVRALGELAPSYRTIVVTSPRHLFHYGDESENAEVFAHVWELLAAQSAERDILVAADTALQVRAAQRVGALLVSASEIRQTVAATSQQNHTKDTTEDTMGHTVASQRNITEDLVLSLSRYARTLPVHERERLQELLRVPLRHAGSIAYANSLDAWAFSLVTIIAHQDERLARLEDAVARGRVPHEGRGRALAQDA